ncbi:MAG: nucleotidyltransferase family protein, partial [Pseudomonadota bacterium]
MGQNAPSIRAEPAFDLLVSCADWPENEARNASIRSAHSALDGDWASFLKEVKRHQLSILAADGLRRAGLDPPGALERLASAQRMRALSLSGEAVRMVEALKECGIDALVLKGPLLSQAIYGDPAKRQSIDLDLLVDWDQFRAAREALAAQGYQLMSNEPPWDDWRIDPWRRLAKDIMLFHPERRIALELHHRLKSPATLLPGLGIAQATQTVDLAGKELRAFGREDLFAYLCVHAATSLWDRLKWLADIRALLAGLEVDEIASLQVHSEQLGTGRCTALGLILCRRLWGQTLPAEIVDLRMRDPKLAELEKASFARLRGPERGPSAIGNSLDRRHLINLRDDPAYRRSQAM